MDKIYHLILIEAKEPLGMDEIIRRINTALEGNLIELREVPVNKPVSVTPEPIVFGIAKYDITFFGDEISNKSIGNIKKNEKFEIIQLATSDQLRTKIKYNNTVGYVNKNYVVIGGLK